MKNLHITVLKLEIGIFVLKNRRKIGKSLSSTKIASLYLITVRIKATSPQLVRSQDLDQLSQLRRLENDQKRLVYRLRYAAIGMICFTTGQAWLKGDHMQIPFKLAANR